MGKEKRHFVLFPIDQEVLNDIGTITISVDDFGKKGGKNNVFVLFEDLDFIQGENKGGFRTKIVYPLRNIDDLIEIQELKKNQKKRKLEKKELIK